MALLGEIIFFSGLPLLTLFSIFRHNNEKMSILRIINKVTNYIGQIDIIRRYLLKKSEISDNIHLVD